MSEKGYTTNVGDYLIVLVDGELAYCIAEVIQAQPLRVKIKETGVYSKIKDFIIREKSTIQFQKDCAEDTNVFLETTFERGQKVYSGLSRLGVIDNQLHEILPDPSPKPEKE